jgi:hypothetical protein
MTLPCTTTAKSQTLQQHHSTAVHVERLLPKVAVRKDKDEIVHVGRRRLEIFETKKSKSTTKDFVALAGTSQIGAKQLSKVTDFNFEFLDHTNSVICASRNSYTPADAHRLCDEHEQSQRERA